MSAPHFCDEVEAIADALLIAELAVESLGHGEDPQHHALATVLLEIHDRVQRLPELVDAEAARRCQRAAIVARERNAAREGKAAE